MSTTEELIARAQQGDRTAAEQLITENNALVWAVVRRYMGRGVEAEDLYQLGSLGFLKAVEGFDGGYGTQFSTYAVPKISGEIRRFLRDDGAVKVSRCLKEQAFAVKSARMQLLQTLLREPTVSEIAQATGLSVEQIAEAEAATAATESIHRQVGEDGFTLESVLADPQSEEKMLEKLALQQALSRLPQREETVIRLRYYHGLTQQRTAKVLGVSQVQVSRIEKKALAKLRTLLD